MNNSFLSETSDDNKEIVFKKIKEILGERFSTSSSVRENHGKDESYHEGFKPDAVAFLNSTQEVSEVLKICYKNSIPVIPFGAGTSLEGHIAAIKGVVSESEKYGWYSKGLISSPLKGPAGNQEYLLWMADDVKGKIEIEKLINLLGF